jgi:hypothetical protein
MTFAKFEVLHKTNEMEVVDYKKRDNGPETNAVSSSHICARYVVYLSDIGRSTYNDRND